MQFLEVALLALPDAQPLEDLKDPLRADATGGTLPAGLPLGELEEIARHIHHAVGVVEDDEAAGAHHRAGFRERLIVHRRVGQPGRYAATRRPADLHRLEAPALTHTAADLLHNLTNRDPHRHLDEPAPLHLARQREHLGAI